MTYLTFLPEHTRCGHKMQEIGANRPMQEIGANRPMQEIGANRPIFLLVEGDQCCFSIGVCAFSLVIVSFWI